MAFTKTIQIPGQLGSDAESEPSNSFQVVSLGLDTVYLTVGGHAHKHPALDCSNIITALTVEEAMTFIQVLLDACKHAGGEVINAEFTPTAPPRNGLVQLVDDLQVLGA